MDVLIVVLFIEVNFILVKIVMNLLGFNVGDLRLFLVEMDLVNLEVLKKELVNFGLKVNV